MSITDESDPYLLAAPTPDSPVIPPYRLGALHAASNSRFADSLWPLSPMSQNPSAKKQTINWSRCESASLRDELKRVAWSMLNGELRPTFMAGRRIRARISVESMWNSIGAWFGLASWLHEQGISTLADCTGEVLGLYAQHLLLEDNSRNHGFKLLTALTRLWAFDQLSNVPIGIGRPPWEVEDIDDYLPPKSESTGENSAEPISERTVGPLLIWAMRMIDDYSDDILAARDEHQQMVASIKARSATTTGQAALAAYLDPLVASGQPIPATKQHGKHAVARTYLSGITGASGKQVDRYASVHLREIVSRRPGPCPLLTPITGTIGGRAWREAIDFNEIHDLVRHLGTAAFIVCAYLTGMRPGEVLGLRTGCCPDPSSDDDGTTSHYLIRGLVYKTALDEHGNHDSAGVEREVPWVAITPVVNAIRVLERMVADNELLFDHHTHDVRIPRPGTGSIKTQGLRLRIKDFIEWANNEAIRLDRSEELIPDDPQGTISAGRFRRSLAWHIARRPNGLVALAIQYGHLRTAVSGNYASRARGGIHELINIETARAVADTVADLHADLNSGGGVSGPAAQRAIKAAATAPRFAGTVITATTARKLLANEDAMLYDNPHSLLLCHYKRAQALCHRDGADNTPRLDHCVPGCGNTVRTDHHAAKLRERAKHLDQQASHTPRPLADRLRTNAKRLRGYADTHDATRIIPEEGLR